MTTDQVREILRAHLTSCDVEQVAAFRRYGVEPYLAPILRYGKLEHVAVVARKSDEVIYWEDVEEGFNASAIGPGRAYSRALVQSGRFGHRAEPMDRRAWGPVSELFTRQAARPLIPSLYEG